MQSPVARILAIIALIMCCFVHAQNNTDLTTSTCKITEYVLALQDDCKFGYDTIHGLWFSDIFLLFFIFC